MPDKRIPTGSLLAQDDYEPGDQPPEGYLAWHEWAEVQHKAGLRQKECVKCGKWRYPQELSGKTLEYTAQRGQHEVKLTGPICNACAT